MFSNSIVRRYAVFLCGVATTGFSISLITKAGLGTPPISSLPYVLCEIFSFSFGTFTFVFNLALIFGQLLLLKKEFTPAQYLQIPVTLLFSCVIDLVMFLLSGLTVEAYPARIALLLAGCVTLGFGIALQVVAEAIYIPGEGLVRAIAAKLKKEFGIIKTVFDSSMVTMAVILSLACCQAVVGFREGTIIAALIVGSIVRFFIRRLQPVREWCRASRLEQA
ncbi:MAG: YitT family protein [Victivallis vadensis]